DRAARRGARAGAPATGGGRRRADLAGARRGARGAARAERGGAHPRGPDRVHGLDDHGLPRPRSQAVRGPRHRRPRPLHAHRGAAQRGDHRARERDPVKRGVVIALVLAAGLALARAAHAAHGGPRSVAFTEPDYLRWLIDSRQPVVVIDLRPRAEYSAGHLPGALSVPITELDRRFGEIPTTPMVVLYCRCPVEEA